LKSVGEFVLAGFEKLMAWAEPPDADRNGNRTLTD
jgi:hypothetical protein